MKKMHGAGIRNTKIHATSKVEADSHVVNSEFARYSFCGYDCTIINCEIGAFCSIANNVVIGGAMHPMDWVSTSPVFYLGRDSVRKKFSEHRRKEDKRTIIGNDVWIGQNAVIKQGIHIGNGAIVGMGSVVTKDVAPYAIVAGNPAKLIRFRFAPELVDRLEQSEWWNLSDGDLGVLAKYITNPMDFLNELDRLRVKYK